MTPANPGRRIRHSPHFGRLPCKKLRTSCQPTPQPTASEQDATTGPAGPTDSQPTGLSPPAGRLALSEARSHRSPQTPLQVHVRRPPGLPGSCTIRLKAMHSGGRRVSEEKCKTSVVARSSLPSTYLYILLMNLSGRATERYNLSSN